MKKINLQGGRESTSCGERRACKFRARLPNSSTKHLATRCPAGRICRFPCRFEREMLTARRCHRCTRRFCCDHQRTVIFNEKCHLNAKNLKFLFLTMIPSEISIESFLLVRDCRSSKDAMHWSLLMNGRLACLKTSEFRDCSCSVYPQPAIFTSVKSGSSSITFSIVWLSFTGRQIVDTPEIFGPRIAGVLRRSIAMSFLNRST